MCSTYDARERKIISTSKKLNVILLYIIQKKNDNINAMLHFIVLTKFIMFYVFN